jgi:pimeloyl-ACP methyl ester carboxylesterase
MGHMSAAGVIGQIHDVRTADGRTLRAHEVGDPAGELVLVHHGTPGWGLLAPEWAADAVARGFRLVGFDRPGYGGSDRQPGRRVADVAADAAALADALGVDRFRTWGASGGGPHALACAALLPDRVVAAAAVAGVAPYDADGLEWTAGMGQDNVDEFNAATQGEQTLRPFIDHANAEMTSIGAAGMAEVLQSILSPVDAALLTGETGEFLFRWMTDGVAGTVDGWVDDDLAFVSDWGFQPAQVGVPVLVVHGGQDLMVPFDHGQWLGGRIPGVTTRFSAEEGHLSTLRTIPDVHTWLLER